MLENTLNMILGFFGTSLEDLKTKLSTAWENISTKITEVWESIKGFFTEIWTGIVGETETGTTNSETTTNTWLDNTKTNFANTWDTIKTTLSTWWTTLTSDMGTWWEGVLTVIKNKHDLIRDWLQKPFDAAKKLIEPIMTSIQGLLDSIKLPHIPVPHISVGWKDTGVMGIKVPKVSVNWYGKGLDAIFDQPTLIGVGEAGPEHVQVTPLRGGGGGEGGGAAKDSEVTLRLNLTVNGQEQDTLSQRLRLGRSLDITLGDLAVTP